MRDRRSPFPRALRALALLAVLAGGFVHAAPAPASPAVVGESEGRAPAESWFSITFHGRKVGFVRARERPGELDGRPAIHVDRWSVITVQRRDDLIRMEQDLDAWFLPDGTPLRYRITRKEGGEVRKGEGYRDGGRFIVRHDVGGRVKTRSFALQEGDHLASSVEWLHLRKPRAGLKVEGRVIDETEGDIQPFRLQVEPGRPARASGGERVYPARETIGSEGGAVIESTLEVSDKRGVVRSELVGAGIVMARVAREEAVRLDDAFDIFSEAMFAVSRNLPARERLDAVTLLLESDPKGPAPRLRSGPLQKARAVGPGRLEVKTRAAPIPEATARIPVRDPKLARYLSGTDYEALEDEQLIFTSRREVGDAKDVWTAARRINGFVHRHLENKTLAHAFASATEALTTRAGDCTEHAVLFSALAKIAGIPTRLVTGLVYVGGAQPAFGYHEWVEVWLGDRWHPMDPTFGQDVADPTHIKFSEGLSDAEGLREAGIAAAGLIGNLTITVQGFDTND